MPNQKITLVQNILPLCACRRRVSFCSHDISRAPKLAQLTARSDGRWVIAGVVGSMSNRVKSLAGILYMRMRRDAACARFEETKAKGWLKCIKIGLALTRT